MRGRRDGTEPPHEHWVNAALTERELRKRGALDADKQIIEWKLGRILRWTLGGRNQPVPGDGPKFDPRQIRGLCRCCYSQRKLFFGSKASLSGDLAGVWHVDSADRIKAQRGTRLADLPPEQRQGVENRIARLETGRLRWQSKRTGRVEWQRADLGVTGHSRRG